MAWSPVLGHISAWFSAWTTFQILAFYFHILSENLRTLWSTWISTEASKTPSSFHHHSFGMCLPTLYDLGQYKHVPVISSEKNSETLRSVSGHYTLHPNMCLDCSLPPFWWEWGPTGHVLSETSASRPPKKYKPFYPIPTSVLPIPHFLLLIFSRALITILGNLDY